EQCAHARNLFILRCGTKDHGIAALRRTTPAITRVPGSLGWVSNRNDLTSRDALNAAGTLIASPTAASSRTRRRTIQTTAPRCAPSAIRIPISPTCRATLYDIVP